MRARKGKGSETLFRRPFECLIRPL